MAEEDREENEKKTHQPGHISTLNRKEFSELIRSGDEESWRRFVKALYPYLFPLIARFFKDKDTIEDVLQETFTRCYMYRSSIKDGKSVMHWAKKIALRVCYDTLKKRSAEKRVKEVGREKTEILRKALIHEYTPKSPEEIVLIRDLLDRVMEKLSPRDRMVLVLTEVEGMSAEEAGRYLGMSRASVKMRCFRAKRKLSKILGKLIHG